MDKGILAIYDYDIDYAVQLMEYLNRKESINLEVQVFSNNDSFEEAISQNIIEILLISERVIQHNWLNKVKKVFILTENNYFREGEEHPYLFKYQSAETLIKDMFSYCIDEPNSIINHAYNLEAGNARVVSVLSPCGGMEASAAAYLLAEQLSISRKILLINWEIFYDIDYYGQGEQQEGLEEFMFYILQGKSNIPLKLKVLTERENNYDILRPVKHYKALCDFTPQDVDILIDYITQYGEYDEVIFILNYFCDSAAHLITLSKNVIITLPENEISKFKLNCFYRYMKQYTENNPTNYKIFYLPWNIRVEMEKFLCERRSNTILNGWIQELIKHGY